MMNRHKLLKQIIAYWDRAGISSFDSSTSNENQHIASCTNFTESSLLNGFLKRQGFSNEIGSGIDIGAGLGRFTTVMAENLFSVYALEPAGHIYSELMANCSKLNNVKTYQTDFESFECQEDFDVAVISGVLYFYSDDMVKNAFKKLSEHCKSGSEIIVRDFITNDGTKRIPSSYISGGFCYYRDTSYWKKLASEYGFDLIEVFQSKPSYPGLKLFWFMRKAGLLRLFGFTGIKRLMYQKTEKKRKKGALDFRSSPILTVFMVMRRL